MQFHQKSFRGFSNLLAFRLLSSSALFLSTVRNASVACIRARHESLPRSLCLFFDAFPLNLATLLCDKSYECQTYQQGGAQKNHIDWNWVVVEGEMGSSIETGLGKIENAG